LLVGRGNESSALNLRSGGKKCAMPVTSKLAAIRTSALELTAATP
jgi:hypothetical protein